MKTKRHTRCCVCVPVVCLCNYILYNCDTAHILRIVCDPFTHLCMTSHLPSRLSLHRLVVLSPPPAEYDEDVAALLNEEHAVKYLTHDHFVHPSFSSDKEEDQVSITWSIDDVRVRREQQARDQEDRKAWHCVLVEDEIFVGVCSLRNIDLYNKSAEMGLCMNAIFWHRPISSEAHFAILRHAFEEIHLRRVSFFMLTTNEMALSFCRKTLHACHEGTLRDYFYHFTEKKFVPAELFSVVSTDWDDTKRRLHQKIISYSEVAPHIIL